MLAHGPLPGRSLQPEPADAMTTHGDARLGRPWPL